MGEKKSTIKRHTPKLKIKKGDKVFVIAGASKDLTTPKEVLEVFPIENRAIVDNANARTKHRKPTQDAAGGLEQIFAPIHLSNLMLVDPKTGTPTRVGRKLEGDKVVRYSKKSGEILE